MTELDPLKMAIELLGGLALFLYGMEKMTDGLKAAAGKQMNTLLAKLTGTPVLGALTGAIVTAVIQSSSVTTVLVVGFVSAGLMTLVQSVGVIFGANVGTTVTAQIVAFNTTALALPLFAVGFVMTFAWKQGVVRHYGAMLLGLGLIFYGMAVMGSAMAPLRTHEGFATLLQSLQNPFLGMLAGVVFTALVQSSSATIGFDVVTQKIEGMIVPDQAVVKSSQGHAVYLIKDGVVSIVPVKLMGSGNGKAAIAGNLEPGGQIAVAQENKLLTLSEGSRVTAAGTGIPAAPVALAPISTVSLKTAVPATGGKP